MKEALGDFLFKNFIIPGFYGFKRQNRISYYNQLKKRDTLSQEELLTIQGRRLRELINHCYNNIPFYKDLFKTLDIHPEDIKTLKDYSYITELKKQNVRDDYKQLIDPRLPDKMITYSATGGSTGIPVKIYKSLEDQEYGFALRYRGNAWCGWEIWHKSLWVVADLKRLTELTTMKKRLGLKLKRRLLVDSRNWNSENMLKWVDQIRSFGPRYVYGYSTLLTEFSRFLLENNITIGGIEGVYSTAEPLVARDDISKAFNTPVYDQYGSSEIPCIAHECKNGNMHINVDEVLVEFIDMPDCPEAKKVVCTPLYIYGMPLLRYDLGDVAFPSEKQCGCGLPYPVMELKVGRISDNFLSPNGKLVPTCNLGWHIAHVTEGIRQYQVIQEEKDYFRIRLVTDGKNVEHKENSLKELFHGLLGTNAVNLRFEYPEAILPEPSGKIRATISKTLEEINKRSLNMV